MKLPSNWTACLAVSCVLLAVLRRMERMVQLAGVGQLQRGGCLFSAFCSANVSRPAGLQMPCGLLRFAALRCAGPGSSRLHCGLPLLPRCCETPAPTSFLARCVR